MPDQVEWRTMERDATAGHAVGRLLRDQREARGLSIADVEKRLRIRRAYLDAIEQGRFNELPGAAYIPAFLRAYARHVGLDPEKVLTAYNLSGPVPIERPVALPADFPLAERRAPIGLAVLTVLLVVGAGYAVWHYLPRHQTVVAEKVPPQTTTATTTVVAPVVATPAPPPASVVSAPIITQPPKETRSVSTNVAPQRQETVAPPAVVAVPAAPPPAVMSAPSAGQAQAAQPTVVDTPAAPAPQEATARPAPQQDATAPLVMNAPVKADTQVIVRTNSWVELRSPNGDVLAQTYVRAGESYVVPAGIAYRVLDAR